MNRKFIYTDKKQSYKGVMSTALGLISLISLVLAIYFTFKNGGIASPRFGAGLIMILIFVVVGIILGLMGKSEDESFHIFAYIGIAFCLVTLLIISGILYAGAYGL